jgi:hypothetical protein
LARGKIHSDQAWRRVGPFKEADAAPVTNAAWTSRRKSGVELSTSRFDSVTAKYRTLARPTASSRRFAPRILTQTDRGTVHVRTSKSGKGRHIVRGDEGVVVFKSFAAGKSGEVRLLARSDGTAWTKSHRPDRWPKPVSALKLNLRFRFTPPYLGLACCDGGRSLTRGGS